MRNLRCHAAISADWAAADEAPGSRAEQSSLTQRNVHCHRTWRMSMHRRASPCVIRAHYFRHDRASVRPSWVRGGAQNHPDLYGRRSTSTRSGGHAIGRFRCTARRRWLSRSVAASLKSIRGRLEWRRAPDCEYGVRRLIELRSARNVLT